MECMMPDRNEGAAQLPEDPKQRVGSKKTPIRSIPPVAIVELGRAMMDGEQKYGRMNWRETAVVSSTYYDAVMRHVLAWWDGEDRASDSGILHLAHAMASLAILIDAASVGTLEDDRPLPGAAPMHMENRS